MMKQEKNLIDAQGEMNKLLDTYDQLLKTYDKLLDTYGQTDSFTKIQVRLIRANAKLILRALRAAAEARIKMQNIQKCARDKFQKTK